MANQTLDALAAAVTNISNAADSATALINGIAGRIQAAVDAALANGATAEELVPVTDEIAALNSKADALSQAVAANT